MEPTQNIVRLMIAAVIFMGSGCMVAGLPNPNVLPPVLTLRLDTTEGTASVDINSPGEVDFNGTLVVQKQPTQTIEVDLSSTTDIGWASQVNPGNLVFSGTTTAAAFTVKVAVPEASRADQPGILTIKAGSTGTGYDVVSEVNATVRVAPYYRFLLDADRPYLELPPGQPASFTFKLSNMGNAPDSFQLEVGNKGNLAAKGWTATLDKNEATGLIPGDTAEMHLTLNTPHEWTIWKSEAQVIIVDATSLHAKAAGLTVSMAFPLVLYQKGPDPATLNSLMALIILISAAVTVAVWRWRRRRARKARAARAAPEEPIEVEPY
jgi:hypothetical protein